MRSTQKLEATVAASLVFTAISTALELFAMRRGVLVMGQNSNTLSQDLRQAPKLISGLVGEGPCCFVAAFNFIWKPLPILQRRIGDLLPALVKGKPVRATAVLLE